MVRDQASVGGSGMPRNTAAIASYRKGLALINPLRPLDHQPVVRLELAILHAGGARVFRRLGQPEQAQTWALRAAGLFRDIANADDAPPELRQAAAEHLAQLELASPVVNGSGPQETP